MKNVAITGKFPRVRSREEQLVEYKINKTLFLRLPFAFQGHGISLKRFHNPLGLNCNKLCHHVKETPLDAMPQPLNP